jgi:LacI family transcriptional regulator
VVGFDDSPIACTIWPELTTVRQPILEMAAEAVRMLVAATRPDRPATQAAFEHKLLSHTFIARESAAPPG